MRSILSRIGILLGMMILFVSGCATLTRPDIDRRYIEEARVDISRIEENNAAVRPYKGIGELKVFSSEGNWAVRGAWTGAPDGRFRVEPLGLAGQPLAKLICDREACYFLFFEDGCYKKRESREKSLKLLTGVDVDINDMALLLGGGVPVYPHDFAWIDPAAPGRVLVLENRMQGIVEKIYAGPDMRINRVEIFGWRGLRYQAEIGEIHLVDGFPVPRALRIENDKNAGIRILVDRSWMNVILRDDVFVPKLPEADRCQ